MATETILVETKGKVGIIRLNRPEECLAALQDERVDFVVTQQGVYVKG